MNALRFLSRCAALFALGLGFAAFPAGCGASAGQTALPAPHAVRSSSPVQPDLAPSAEASAEPVAEAKANAVSHRFGVASENPMAARMALSVLERGGSAVDAAITGLLAVGVMQPVSSGIGGGGFAVVWDAKAKKMSVLDFRETAPRGIKANDYVVRPPKAGKEALMTGVPGEVAGLYEMHARWGKLAFADLVRLPQEAAIKGFPVSVHLSRVLKMNEKWVLKTPRYSFFHAAGALLDVGKTAVNTALGETLARIAAEGKAAFYEGAIAKDIVETARASGSRMALDDLKAYAVVERSPLKTVWEGHEVYTMPPPSAGGLLLLETLNMYSKAELEALGWGTGVYQHMLAETFRGALSDRVRAVGDPAFAKVDADALAHSDRMKARRAKIAATAVTPAEKFSLGSGGTSHLVTVDEEGNVVSVTSTVNNMFGAKVITQGGFPLNDQLDDFTPQRLGKLYGALPGPNAPRPLARPVSSMTPTIVLKNGEPILALGGSGGTRIATGTTQVLLAHLVFGKRVSEAVSAPRIETPAMGGLMLDPGAKDALIKDLEARGEAVNATTPNYSAVQAISIQRMNGARVIEASADPRKAGEGIVK